MDAEADFSTAIAEYGTGDGGRGGGHFGNMDIFLVFMCDDAVAGGEEQLGYRAEEPP